MSAVGLNTVAGLQKALKTRMEAVAARFPLLETKTGHRAPTVRDGWLGPKADADQEDFPFLAVRPRTGEDSEESADQNARATFEIVVATYSDEDDGWLDVALLVDAIRFDIGEHPRIAGTAFSHVGPLRWEIPATEQQPRPQWFGIVTTTWSLPRPRRAEG